MKENLYSFYDLVNNLNELDIYVLCFDGIIIKYKVNFFIDFY